MLLSPLAVDSCYYVLLWSSSVLLVVSVLCALWARDSCYSLVVQLLLIIPGQVSSEMLGKLLEGIECITHFSVDTWLCVLEYL